MSRKRSLKELKADVEKWEIYDSLGNYQGIPLHGEEADRFKKNFYEDEYGNIKLKKKSFWNW